MLIYACKLAAGITMDEFRLLSDDLKTPCSFPGNIRAETSCAKCDYAIPFDENNPLGVDPPTLIATILTQILCPGCGWVLARQGDNTLACVNLGCGYKGRLFKSPTIPIELIPIPKEDTNADSRSAGTPGGPADA
jgi:hypothetical protein